MARVGRGLSIFGLEPVGPSVIAKVIAKFIVIFVIKPAGFGAYWAELHRAFDLYMPTGLGLGPFQL